MFRTIDIPQADSFSLVRRIVEAVHESPARSVRNLAEHTGFSERHVRYRLATARLLGLVVESEGDLRVTSRGLELLLTTPGSSQEKEQLRWAVERCTIIQVVAPELLSGLEYDLAAVAKRIVGMSNLSQSTAERRAQVLRSWRRQLL